LPGATLLDFIRYHQQLTGTKIGCREGDCGACTVLAGELVNDKLQYRAMTSCLMPLGNAQGKHIVTIEGVNLPGKLNPVQQAMADCGATQCGFCTPGVIMSLTGFCLNGQAASYENAIAAIDGNICRCTGYKSIERAAGIITGLMKEKDEEAIAFAVKKKIVPGYFSAIKKRLSGLSASKSKSLSHKPGTIPVGGGTDLYVQKHHELVRADIHFVFDKEEFNYIRKGENKCIIGPSVTVSDLRDSPIIKEAFPGFYKFSKLISSTPIRNMATLAGNFVNASPIGDMTIFFLALDAQTELSNGKTKRILPLRQFYKGYKQLDKKPDETISGISFELPGKDTFFNFEKVSKRTHLDIATVNSAICLKMNGDMIEAATVSAGGVGPVPMYLQKTSDYFIGKKINDETVNGAIEIMKTEISPISDARGSAEYKTLLLGQLIKAHFQPLNE
jgi:xanthine dehydrogenase small subunit